MVYNLTGIMDNTTGMLSFIQGVNSNLMNGLLGVLFLIGIGVICFLTFLQVMGDTNRAVAGTSFVCFLLAVLLAAMQLIPPLALYITLFSSAGALAYTWKSRT